MYWGCNEKFVWSSLLIVRHKPACSYILKQLCVMKPSLTASCLGVCLCCIEHNRKEGYILCAFSKKIRVVCTIESEVCVIMLLGNDRAVRTLEWGHWWMAVEVCGLHG